MMTKQFQDDLILWNAIKQVLPFVEQVDVGRALRAISLVEERMIGRHCGDLCDKLLQYLSIVQFVRATGKKTVDSIEIGTLFGGSCLAKLFAMRDFELQGKIVCIDPMSGYYDQDVDPNTGLSVNVGNFLKNIELFGFSKDIIDPSVA